MSLLKVFIVAVSMMAAPAFAGEYVYKYSINTFFGISSSCSVKNEKQVSRVRFIVSPEDIKSNKDFVRTEIQVTVCVITGEFVKEGNIVMLPRFIFTEAPRLQGTFKLNHPGFSKISVNELKKDQWQVQLFDQAGQPWKVIDPIQLTMNVKENRAETLRFFVKSKNKWLDAKFQSLQIN